MHRSINIQQKKWYFKNLYAASCFMTIHSLVQLIYILTRKKMRQMSQNFYSFENIGLAMFKSLTYIYIGQWFKWANDGMTSESGDCEIDIARPSNRCSQSCGLVLGCNHLITIYLNSYPHNRYTHNNSFSNNNLKIVNYIWWKIQHWFNMAITL